MDGRNTCELPIQPDCPDESSPSQLIVADIVDFQSAVFVIAQQQIGFTGVPAKITDAGKLPIEPNRADEGCAGDLVVLDIVDLDPAGVDVAQDHVVFAKTRKIAEPHRLPIQSYCPQESGIRDEIIADVVNF